MTTYQDTVRSASYQQVARVLETLEAPATGYVQTSAFDEKTSTNTFSRLILKQNNFIIEALCQLREAQKAQDTEIELIKQRISRLESSTAGSQKATSIPDLSGPIAEISQQLQSLTLGKKLGPTKPSGKLHVVKNPQTIYEELAKLKRDRAL